MSECIVLPQTETVNRFGLEPALLEGIIINENVTWKVHYAQSLTDEDIRKAGKSGLKFSDGVLVNKRGVFISGSFSGKMHDMPGISGYAGNNKQCLQRAMNGCSVCAHCYSLIGIWKTCIPAYTKNDLIFSTEKFEVGDLVLDPERFPYFRFSTHGDTINALHVYNMLVTARTNPDTQFTLWTKNLGYWGLGLQMYKDEFHTACKPQNFFTLYSPLSLDYFPTDEALQGLKLLEVDAIFCVYTTYAEQNKAVELGAWSCMCGTDSCRHHCKFCYDREVRNAWGKASAGKAIWVAEILDGARHKE